MSIAVHDTRPATAAIRPHAGLIEACRPPAHYYIDLGNHCNLRCPFCITGAKSNTQAAGFMRLEQYRTVLGRISHAAKLIALYNWGEPFLNPDLLPIIRLTAALGIRTHIDSNLSTKDFTPAYAEELVNSGLSSLFGSIDGASQPTYEVYRVRGRFDRAFGNLALLARTKSRLGASTPLLGWQYHVHRYNEADMDRARQLSEDIGVPIVFKRLSTPEPDWKSSCYTNDDMFIGPRAWFWQVYAPPPNPDLHGVGFHPGVTGACRQMFGTMIVDWNGDVYPCTVVSGPDHVMGNLLRDSLEEVWNGIQFRRSRDFILGFGPEQKGQSVCENHACALNQKCAAG